MEEEGEVYCAMCSYVVNCRIFAVWLAAGMEALGALAAPKCSCSVAGSRHGVTPHYRPAAVSSLAEEPAPPPSTTTTNNLYCLERLLTAHCPGSNKLLAVYFAQP